MKPFRRRSSGAHDLSPAQSEARLRTAPRVTASTGASGLRTARYTQICAILLKYLSPILVESVLQKSMQSKGLSSETLDGAALAEITGDIMVGLRLFVPSERLPELMLELAEILESQPS